MSHHSGGGCDMQRLFFADLLVNIGVHLTPYQNLSECRRRA